ncbi:appr-1-p processing enzyme family protein [Melanomma pulvis-pyrius CBS 109.77]|uniref:Appr-1-p processing enzyme family protein n=1 Tax=Melanomma pulvis-pyrius CBS 109.77 TaxID=1314802 RepID=A0A6A6XP36_9PLEO|nr:appr-1-p processing enzyme family protein [Melanomma pulvis-pyrius CBS 109.77]
MLPKMTSTLTKALSDSLSFLLNERFQTSPQHARRHLASALRSETYHQLQLFQQLLCQRSATPSIPSEISHAIDKILIYQLNNKILTKASSIPAYFSVERTSSATNDNKAPIKLSLWRGDITTLTDVTAVVNAANSELLGCFQPTHKCIDNIIHAAAGPRLRQEMHRLMVAQNHAEPVGRAKVTPAFNLPAKNIVHTVGPRMGGAKQAPQVKEREQLASCYRECLDAIESLPLDENGELSIAFCCISTGLFAFPKEIAAGIAVETVMQWCEMHPDTPVTHIIFDVFMEDDLDLYAKELDSLARHPISQGPESSIPCQLAIGLQSPQSLIRARNWILDADYLIISAGAGLSAADGLDYTSTSLFTRHYPALLQYGLRCLYDTIGFSSWPSASVKWGYFFTHANLIRNWPKSPLYASLLSLTSKLGKDRYFVRTSNADGLFAANEFPESRVSTPQGRYEYLQCFAKCRPDAVFPTSGFLDAALPFIDAQTQTLTDESLIPQCEFCGTELTLCVRGGSYFNETPFEEEEDAWYDFVERIRCDEGKSAVILELGVGLNTAGVLRWPNEHLAETGNEKFRLVRVGLGPSACVPFELVENEMAVVVDGDVKSALEILIH